MTSRLVSLVVLACALALSMRAVAADLDRSLGKISLIPSASAAIAPAETARAPASELTGEALVFAAPPRESAAEAQRLYQPVAEYLTRVLRRSVTYVHPRSELSYQKDMARGAYDIVFDDAHFTSWRIARLGHNVLARLADRQVYAVVIRHNDAQTTNVQQLAGRKVCAAGSADLATLTLLAEFDALRQPLVIEQVGWKNIVEAVVEGRCTAGTVPLAMLPRLGAAGVLTRVLHQSQPLPNHAFSAGPRVTASEQLALSQALTSADGARALAALLAANGASAGLAQVSANDYAGMDRYLNNVWGYAR
jgi:ABC-type phosphate/phosphonate transport system substrate-binding protein